MKDKPPHQEIMAETVIGEGPPSAPRDSGDSSCFWVLKAPADMNFWPPSRKLDLLLFQAQGSFIADFLL